MLKTCVYLLCGYVLITAAIAAKPEEKSHNISWGARSPRDVHISREIISEKAKPLRVVSDDYEFRQTREKYPYARTITQIVVTDQYNNGDGGFATLKSGGPNTDYAVLHLKSQRGHGYNFIIDIFGQ